MDYKQAYLAECEKNHKLAGTIADDKRKIDDLEKLLFRIKNNMFWKLSKPFRGIIHLLMRIINRIRRYGSPKNFYRKVKNKLHEKHVQSRYGKESFPDAKIRTEEENVEFPRDITFSILVPLYNTPVKFLHEMIMSVQAQTYKKWELCLADGSDSNHKNVGQVCEEYAKSDPRICYKKLDKNEGISGNTNACYKMAQGEYIGLFDHDDILHPSALYEYMRAICEKNADYIYCDEATFKNGNINKMITLHFKSDYAPDTLRANNYICHFSVFDIHLLDGEELFRTRFDGSQDHDMILRLTSAAKHVVHVPRILYYWRSHKGSVASGIGAKTYAIEAARNAVTEHLKVHGFTDFEVANTKAFETIFRVKYKVIGNPKISIIIPNKDHVTDLRRCVDSVLRTSTYDNIELIIVENNSVENEIFAYYHELEQEEKVQIVKYSGDFNYSAINNLGAGFATGEYLVLLNNDTQVIACNWLEELLMYAQRLDVGAVGAKLYYADKTIQHAGVVIGLGAHRTAGHTHYGVGPENVGYMGKLCYAQDVTAVTGACMMVKKSLFDELKGLDEGFAVALNDVDFCLRLREKGLLNIFNPYCELYHFESKSRGMDNEGERAKRYDMESERFREKWKDALEAGDPYYNPNFSLDYSDFRIK